MDAASQCVAAAVGAMVRDDEEEHATLVTVVDNPAGVHQRHGGGAKGSRRGGLSAMGKGNRRKLAKQLANIRGSISSQVRTSIRALSRRPNDS